MTVARSIIGFEDLLKGRKIIFKSFDVSYPLGFGFHGFLEDLLEIDPIALKRFGKIQYYWLCALESELIKAVFDDDTVTFYVDSRLR